MYSTMQSGTWMIVFGFGGCVSQPVHPPPFTQDFCLSVGHLRLSECTTPGLDFFFSPSLRLTSSLFTAQHPDSTLKRKEVISLCLQGTSCYDSLECEWIYVLSIWMFLSPLLHKWGVWSKTQELSLNLRGLRWDMQTLAICRNLLCTLL